MAGRITKRAECVQLGDGALAPVTDGVLSRLYRANQAEVEEIAVTLAPDTRARLAVFCYARAHLREVGRQIAWMCEPGTLLRNGGSRLADALANSATELHFAAVQHHRARVSLASPKHMQSRW